MEKSMHTDFFFFSFFLQLDSRFFPPFFSLSISLFVSFSALAVWSHLFGLKGLRFKNNGVNSTFLTQKIHISPKLSGPLTRLFDNCAIKLDIG